MSDMDADAAESDGGSQNLAAQRRSLDILPMGDNEEESEADIQEEPNADEPQPILIEDDNVVPENNDVSENVTVPAESVVVQEQQADIIDVDSTSPPKKRKRASVSKQIEGTPVAKPNRNIDDEDDGMTCPICLESWEMSGPHRLAALKCGHLFGDNCIRRWLRESYRQSAVKVCPQCKRKASSHDIRFLYAKRLRALDRTEEHELRIQLDNERQRNESLITELATTKMSHSMTLTKLKVLQMDYDRLRDVLRTRSGYGGAYSDDSSNRSRVNELASHRLYMEKNFEITREPGCRVLLYSATQSMLFASQKSAQNLFPGYGIRFIDPASFKPNQFLHTSAQMVRDIVFSESQRVLAVASRETRVKTFDIRSRQCSNIFATNDKQLWSCSVDRNEREHFLYAGDLHGGVYVFDMRFPDTVLTELQSEENFSPVINIATVPAGRVFTNGGFLVCQLSQVKFYEYADDTVIGTRLDVDGPFLSMQFDVIQETVLFSARSNAHNQHSRFILGKLEKIDNVPVFVVKATILGSAATPYMTRPTQLGVEDNTLVVGYLQDTKQLMMYDVRREERAQTLPVNEVVYDICPVNTQSGSYMAALTDNKCRVYKVTSFTNHRAL